MEIDKTLRHDKRKITLIILGALIVLLTVTYAYYMFQVGNGSKTNIDITSDTVDRLTFINGDPISLRVNQFTLAEGSSTNVTGSTSSSANLKANSYNTTASSTYNAYFVIDSNTFTYTNGTTPEMLLSITDPTGATVTSITGLTYVTQNGVSGFDITNKDDTYVIASNYAISANNATTGTTQTWNATVTFLNLTTDQTGNEGKKINASLVLQKETMVIADLKYTVATDGTNGLAKSISAGGYDASVSCTQGSATWSNKYWGMVEDLSTSAKQKCAITYTTKASKTYLNTMVTGLAGQTTGTGQVVHETISTTNFTPTTTYDSSYYTNTSNDATYPFTWDSTAKTWTSTNKTNSATATFTFKPSTAGTVGFCYTVSSEAKYDKATIYVDDVSKGVFSGSGTSCLTLNDLTASNVVKVTYSKDSSASFGNDNVIFYFTAGTASTDNYDVGYRYEGFNPNNYVWFNNEL